MEMMNKLMNRKKNLFPTDIMSDNILFIQHTHIYNSRFLSLHSFFFLCLILYTMYIVFFLWLIKRWLIQILLLGILLFYIGFGFSFSFVLVNAAQCFFLLSVVYECIYGFFCFFFFSSLSCLVTLFVYKFFILPPSSVLLLLCCVWFFFLCLWCIKRETRWVRKKKRQWTKKSERIYLECFILFIDALEKMKNCDFE
jgi:hypothetical protein